LASVDGGVAPGVSVSYLNELTGQNPGTEPSTASNENQIIPGIFGAPINRSRGGSVGGSGLLLDTSGTKAADQVNNTNGAGGIGYGAGGCSDSDGITGSTAGASGAVLVEWMEVV
jgi:hypothetical protein